MSASCYRCILHDLLNTIIGLKRKVPLTELKYKEFFSFSLVILDILILHKNLLEITQFHNSSNISYSSCAAEASTPAI